MNLQDKNLQNKTEKEIEVSIIVPMRTSASQIFETVESIFAQDKVSFEVIFIDSGSLDRAHEIVQSFVHMSCVQFIQMPLASDAEMIQEGIQRALGGYVQVLFPGSSYLMPSALFQVMGLIRNRQFPDLFYTAAFQRGASSEQKLLFLPLKEELLRLGKTPTLIECCWFKKIIFDEELDRCGFDHHTQQAIELDLFTQIARNKGLCVASEMRVFIDTGVGEENWRSLFIKHREIGRVIKKYFGFFWAACWMFKKENVLRLCGYLKKKVELAFQKK